MINYFLIPLSDFNFIFKTFESFSSLKLKNDNNDYNLYTSLKFILRIGILSFFWFWFIKWVIFKIILFYLK